MIIHAILWRLHILNDNRLVKYAAALHLFSSADKLDKLYMELRASVYNSLLFYGRALSSSYA